MREAVQNAFFAFFHPRGFITPSGVIFMKNRLVYLVKISVLAVIASLIMLLEFPLPFAPPFYKLDLSEVAVLIAGFALGPVAGVLTELFKILINLLMDGTTTAFVGEAANFAIGVSFILPASLIYKYKKSLSGALIGMAAGTVSLVVIGALINYFVMIPAYSKFLIPMESIIAMGNSVNVGIDSLLTLVLFATVPFNLVKGLACSLITALVYKRISPLLKPKKQIASTNEAIK